VVFDFGKTAMPQQSKPGKNIHEFFKVNSGALILRGQYTQQREAQTLAGKMASNLLTKDLLNSIVQQEETCDLTVSETVYFVQRHEYANLFHTFTDYWNACIAFKMFGPQFEPYFFDNHAPGPLDSPWLEVFRYGEQERNLKSLWRFVEKGSLGRVCFKNVIFSMLGYSSHFGHKVFFFFSFFFCFFFFFLFFSLDFASRCV
jgi:hypothetical protein